MERDAGAFLARKVGNFASASRRIVLLTRSVFLFTLIVCAAEDGHNEWRAGLPVLDGWGARLCQCDALLRVEFSTQAVAVFREFRSDR